MNSDPAWQFLSLTAMESLPYPEAFFRFEDKNAQLWKAGSALWAPRGRVPRKPWGMEYLFNTTCDMVRFPQLPWDAFFFWTCLAGSILWNAWRSFGRNRMARALGSWHTNWAWSSEGNKGVKMEHRPLSGKPVSNFPVGISKRFRVLEGLHQRCWPKLSKGWGPNYGFSFFRIILDLKS